MKENFKKKVLENGLTILFEKRDLPVVSVAIAVRNGSIHENISEKGISHFIEHMLYKGTPKRSSEEIAKEIERNGGDLNGFTSEEVTAYWCKLPSNHFNVGLDVISDMIKNPLFSKKEIEKERKVIFEEIKMRKDTPRAYVFDKIQECLFSGTMAINIAGNFKTMKSIGRKELLGKFKSVYSPKNLILSVVGKADFDKIVEFAKKTFSKEDYKDIEEKRPDVQEFEFQNDSKIEKRKGIDQANFVFAYHVPLAKEKKSHAARVLSVLSAEGMSSRLFSEIREKRNLAYAVKGGSDINRNFSINFVYVGTNKENLESIKKIILNDFEDISENLTEKELEEIKEQMIGNYRISMEDSQSQMVNLLSSEIKGNARDFYDFEKNISNVKLQEIKDLAKKAYEEYSSFALVPE